MDPLQKILSQMTGDSDSDREEAPSPEDFTRDTYTEERLLELVALYRKDSDDLQAGDHLTRKEGLGRYKYPHKGSIAILGERFPRTVVDEEGKAVNGSIIVMVPCPKSAASCGYSITTFAVDLNYYEKAPEATH